MKTAVSIPDHIFEAAERVARRTGITRSELYARALAELLHSQDEVETTAALDRVYTAHDATLEPALANLPARVLEREEW